MARSKLGCALAVTVAMVASAGRLGAAGNDNQPAYLTHFCREGAEAPVGMVFRPRRS